MAKTIWENTPLGGVVEGAKAFAANPSAVNGVILIAGVVPGGRQVAKVGRTLTVQQAGEMLAHKIGKNRVSVMTAKGRMHIDLAGDAHFEKSLGTSVSTPHVKFQQLNSSPAGKTSLSPGKTEPATMIDIRTAKKIIKRRG